MKKVVLSVLLLGIVGTSAEAAVTVYTDRTSFNTAVGPIVLENFNSFASETPFHTTALDVGDFTLSMTGSPNTGARRNKIDLPPYEWSVSDIDGTNVVNVLTILGDSLFITFDSPITAFGADFAAFNDGHLRTTIVVSTEVLNPPATAGNDVRLFGFTSDTPFTVVEARAVDNDGYAIDNVSYSVVPEPAMICLLGLGGLLLRRRKA